jgi:hypothetical protein
MNFKWLEITAWIVGLVCAHTVFENPKTRQAGIGPKAIQALSLCLVVPLILTLGLEKILSGETIAAIIGGVVGFGLPKGSDTPAAK